MVKSISKFIVNKKEKKFKMNKRLIVALILVGMITRLLPGMIQLGLFSSLFIYLFMSWDEYMYQYGTKKRKEFSK